MYNMGNDRNLYSVACATLLLTLGAALFPLGASAVRGGVDISTLEDSGLAALSIAVPGWESGSCTGTIVYTSDNHQGSGTPLSWVLTAGHCFFDSEWQGTKIEEQHLRTQIAVKIGYRTTSGFTESNPVPFSSVAIHPEWLNDPDWVDTPDIALIRFPEFFPVYGPTGTFRRELYNGTSQRLEDVRNGNTQPGARYAGAGEGDSTFRTMLNAMEIGVTRELTDLGNYIDVGGCDIDAFDKGDSGGPLLLLESASASPQDFATRGVVAGVVSGPKPGSWSNCYPGIDFVFTSVRAVAPWLDGVTGGVLQFVDSDRLYPEGPLPQPGMVSLCDRKYFRGSCTALNSGFVEGSTTRSLRLGDDTIVRLRYVPCLSEVTMPGYGALCVAFEPDDVRDYVTVESHEVMPLPSFVNLRVHTTRLSAILSTVF